MPRFLAILLVLYIVDGLKRDLIICFNVLKLLCKDMDYLRMDGKQYASKVRNKALEDFDWLSQWLE